MPPANMETDPFFVLLTDALRSGPGSPQWHQAVAALKQQGLEGSDEHRLLIEARENLESGREYRSVRAGPGFTRRVMNGIEQGPGGGRRTGVPTATIIAVVCGLLILAVVAYVGYRLVPRPASGQQAIEDLAAKSQSFLDTVATGTFSGAIPQGWHRIGLLSLDESSGLRPKPDPDQVNKEVGGGVVWNESIPAGQAFAVDVTAHVGEATSAVLLEAFITTESKLSPEKGTSSSDLVWQLRGSEQQVLLNGSGQILNSPPTFASGDTVRLIVDQNVAIIEVVSVATGKTRRLWAGPHELMIAPRYIGVRFLQTGSGGKQDLGVQQIKITTSQR